VLTNRAKVGQSVALVGAGGIGHDVAAFLLHDPAAEHAGNDLSDANAAASDSAETQKFMSYWGIDGSLQAPGGLLPRNIPPPRRKLYLLQRKTEKVGAGLGKTTGWIHRAILKVRQSRSWLAALSLTDTHFCQRITFLLFSGCCPPTSG
jgi:2,4-dienoyl-CoA reductase (NADPH2)